MSLESLSVLERPAVVRDREHVLRGIKLALLRFSVATHTTPEETLDRLTRDFLRDIAAHGIELRKSRKVRP